MNSSLPNHPPPEQKPEERPLWIEQITDDYFRRLPPPYSFSPAGSAFDRPALLNTALESYTSRLLESARSLLAGIAPLHRSVDHCRLCISATDETAGKGLEKGLNEAHSRTVELVRTLEKVEERRDGSDHLDDLSQPGILTARTSSSSSLSSSSLSRTTASPTWSTGASNPVDPAVLDELADRCANATMCFRSLLRELRPHLLRLGRHLEPRKLRFLLLTTHGAAAELCEAWTLLASVLAEPRPIFQTGRHLQQGRIHGQPSPRSQRSGPPTPSRLRVAEIENASGPFRTVPPSPTSPTSASSSSSQKPIIPPSGRNRGIPDSRVRSAAEAAIVVANRVLGLLESTASGCPDLEENSNTVLHDHVVGFFKQIPVARQATTRLASALEAMVSIETNSGISAGATASESDIAKSTAAGGRVMEEAEEFVKSVIYLSTLAKDATTHRNDHPLNQTFLSGIGMVTRSTKELALALQGPLVGKKSNGAGFDGGNIVRQ